MQETKAKSSQFGDMALESTQTGFIQKLLKECRQKVKQEKDTIQSVTQTTRKKNAEFSQQGSKLWPSAHCGGSIKSSQMHHIFDIFKTNNFNNT